MASENKDEADAKKDLEEMRKEIAKLAAANKGEVSKLKKLMKDIEKEAKKK